MELSLQKVKMWKQWINVSIFFFNEEILDILILHTNEKKNASMGINKKWKPVDHTEINAFLGLLLFVGRFGESRKSKHNICRKNTALSRSIYTVMSRDQLKEILQYAF